MTAESMPLSVLDLSPVPTGTRPSQALHETLELARTAEAAGYHRFWLAEHHNIPSVVSTSPEVMIAAVAAATSTIRVGSGGIMLPNHSPLKVAETFRVLGGLYPDRIDLGIGRAPGTDQRTALALRRSREALGADDFTEQYAELRAYVEGFPAGHPFEPISAQPDDVPLPPVWILGSSTYGGQAAAALGTGFAYAGHFGTLDPSGVIASYKENFQRPGHEPHAILALAAIVAETEERAAQLARANALSTLNLRSGRPGPLPSPEEAAAYPWTDAELAAIEDWTGLVSVGTPDQVAADLRRRAEVAGADELIITTNIHNPAERRRSFQLLAEAWGLKPR
ncbi:LLM class flavin-dependent oxidoreductase [Kribbella solani]|uniref:Luciferase family oxidoreductase group 1 n=1 Tax=Kribbella solani TaxID=236067 RepID=A0A841DZA2_9ACTN|nr:LLM class flavin-dependent oxidoreductase [Kribbella solani]MBB5982096.1 luciferase family oxidoreductase group 1 [Kribbella solani]MDX2969869.1 LLM class flavin-dependent oxidoreductase [Kribbella solani]MDX2969903.1 LLM class flavin-dependent oxidoreductase [Kribbella solani]MDX3004041.1 LLM class flavin-dependent oxidoreductase [Kribbella solani]